MMETVSLIIRLLLFGVFALAAIGKILDIAGSEKAFRDFGVPDPLVRISARILPVAEYALAVMLLFAGVSWYAAVGSLMLLLVFIGGMIFQIAKGSDADCHCFGQIHSEPVGKASLLRNIGFGILAVFLVVAGPENQGLTLAETPVGAIQIIVLLTGFIMLAAALSYLKQTAERQATLQRRLEMLEMFSGEGGAIERDDMGSPEDGLPIGSPFPDFELPSAAGRIVTMEHLIADGQPVLMFFVGPDCTPCSALFPQILAWRNELAGQVSFVFVSKGTGTENLEKFKGMEADRILLQQKRELADTVLAKWTPTALFLDRDGRIASHPATGDSAITQLVEKIKREDLMRDFLFFSNSNGFAKPPKIGSRIPDFSIDDLYGKTFSTTDFVGHKALAVFWSLGCPHCRQMIEEIKEWERSASEQDPRLFIFSDGDLEAHRALDVKSPILLDKSYSVSSKLGMHGTPSAVLIDENGIIITETGIGSPNIWALLGKRRVFKTK